MEYATSSNRDIGKRLACDVLFLHRHVNPPVGGAEDTSRAADSRQPTTDTKIRVLFSWAWRSGGAVDVEAGKGINDLDRRRMARIDG